MGGSLFAAAANQRSIDPDRGAFDLWRQFGFVAPEDVLSGRAIASAPATAGEVIRAFRILWSAPRGVSPLEVARYFYGSKVRDLKNEQGESYNAEWTTRFNPVIVGFWTMVRTLPAEGDQTAWCAAFVNFCLAAGDRPMTYNPLSGSFRQYGDPTDDPQPRDIAVFRAGGAAGEQGFGHVAFFLERDADTVTVLGGNQREAGNTGAVTISTYRRAGTGLRLHSYRKMPPPLPAESVT
jgi:uncharacterized protein (TIGR02594 family)